MELIIDFESIGDASKKDWLLKALKLMGISYEIKEFPQSREGYNRDLQAGNAEIDEGNYITAEELKKQAGKW